MHVVRAFAASCFLGVAACSIGAAETTPPVRACPAIDESMTAGLKQPGSPMQLLQNINTLMTANALVRESSFTEQALTQSLGAVAFRWISRSSLKMVDMRHFAATPAGTADDFSIYASFDSNLQGSGQQQGQVIVLYSGDSARTDALIALFGNDYKMGAPRTGPIAAPTDPEGNQVYLYEFICSGVRTWLALRLDSGGSLHELSLTQRVHDATDVHRDGASTEGTFARALLRPVEP